MVMEVQKMTNEMEFEKSVNELKKKVEDLRDLAKSTGIDLSNEINKLEEKVKTMTDEMYENLNAWQKVQLARHQQRPTTQDYINEIIENFIELHGDRTFADDAAIIGGIGMFEGIPVTVIGHQKGKNTKESLLRNFGMAHPEGYRKALRLMQQAEKFKRPIICFINTAGAYPGKEAEERGQSEAIARNLREMAGLKVPIICIVMGEGGSGGALALGVGNKVYMLENSFYSVISPEGAAALLWKDATQAKKAAETMKITAEDLLKLGVIDGIIKEVKGGAHLNIKEQAVFIKDEIDRSLKELIKLTPKKLVENRYEKYRNIGEYKE
jgi:acetyl-CoA carboxylase carboxyl transferase subunit alpha